MEKVRGTSIKKYRRLMKEQAEDCVKNPISSDA
jgi:hypothetical protein